MSIDGTHKALIKQIYQTRSGNLADYNEPYEHVVYRVASGAVTAATSILKMNEEIAYQHVSQREPLAPRPSYTELVGYGPRSEELVLDIATEITYRVSIALADNSYLERLHWNLDADILEITIGLFEMLEQGKLFADYKGVASNELEETIVPHQFHPETAAPSFDGDEKNALDREDDEPDVSLTKNTSNILTPIDDYMWYREVVQQVRESMQRVHNEVLVSAVAEHKKMQQEIDSTLHTVVDKKAFDRDRYILLSSSKVEVVEFSSEMMSVIIKYYSKRRIPPPVLALIYDGRYVEAQIALEELGGGFVHSGIPSPRERIKYDSDPAYAQKYVDPITEIERDWRGKKLLVCGLKSADGRLLSLIIFRDRDEQEIHKLFSNNMPDIEVQQNLHNNIPDLLEHASSTCELDIVMSDVPGAGTYNLAGSIPFLRRRGVTHLFLRHFLSVRVAHPHQFAGQYDFDFINPSKKSFIGWGFGGVARYLNRAETAYREVPIGNYKMVLGYQVAWGLMAGQLDEIERKLQSRKDEAAGRFGQKDIPLP